MSNEEFIHGFETDSLPGEFHHADHVRLAFAYLSVYPAIEALERFAAALKGDATKIDDIRFTNYRPLAGAWIAAGVEVWAEGKKVFSEDYSDIQADVKLGPGTFDPAQFAVRIGRSRSWPLMRKKS